MSEHKRPYSDPDFEDTERGSLGDPLSAAQRYLERASECLRLAEIGRQSATMRQRYVEIAQSYEKLAADMELIHANRQQRERSTASNRAT